MYNVHYLYSFVFTYIYSFSLKGIFSLKMWMSAGKARLPASLIVSTRWAATRVPVPGDMSSTEMAKHAGVHTHTCTHTYILT